MIRYVPLLLVLPSLAFAQTPCDTAERTALYADYDESRSKKNAAGAPDPAAQKKAYETAKKYAAQYGAACPDQYTEAVTKFITAYDAAADRLTLVHAAFGATPDHAKAFETGRKILAATPNDVPALLALAHAGDAALTAKNQTYVKEALGYAKKAIQEIESGKEPADWNPFKTRDEAVAVLYYYASNLAAANQETANVIPWLVKSVSLEGPTKRQAAIYGRLASAYHAVLKPMQDEYNTKFAGKWESPEGKFTYEQIGLVLERIIDAYARAVHLSGDDPRYAAAKTAWRDALESYYKVRAGGKMPGFDAYIANAMNRPVPAPYEKRAFQPPKAAGKK